MRFERFEVAARNIASSAARTPRLAGCEPGEERIAARPRIDHMQPRSRDDAEQTDVLVFDNMMSRAERGVHGHLGSAGIR